jgi:hypothetical protein
MDRKVFGAEFRQYLEAGSAGRDRFAAAAYDGESLEVTVTCGNGGGNGCSLGAQGKSIRGVFDVAAGKDMSVRC